MIPISDQITKSSPIKTKPCLLPLHVHRRHTGHPKPATTFAAEHYNPPPSCLAQTHRLRALQIKHSLSRAKPAAMKPVDPVADKPIGTKTPHQFSE
ncbi:hypothetical protein ACLB2K_029708 [Fragaria x ananassa]